MIYRKLGFEVIYQTPEGIEQPEVGFSKLPDGRKRQFVRASVKELHFAEGSGYDEAITTDGKTVQLNPTYTALLEFTGAFDKAGAPIFHGHICLDENDDAWEVIFADGAFMLCRGEETKPLSNENAMQVRIVGDSIRNVNLLAPADGVEKLEAAEAAAAGNSAQV